MKIRQFINTFKQITRAEDVGTAKGIAMHLSWQFRKMTRRFPVDLRVSKSILRVDRAEGVGALINCMGMYDYNNMNLVKFFLRQCSHPVFFDVGANIGAYSLIASEVSEAMVYSFEPHPASYSRLIENVSLNNRKNINTLNLAVSNASGRANMTNKTDLATNMLAGPEDIKEENPEVEMQTLDRICRELSVYPSIIKIDVEGHEVQALKGFRHFLQQTLVAIIENGENETIRNLMIEAGFDGPCWFQLKTRSFRETRQERAEDPVYVKENQVQFLFDTYEEGF